MTAVLEFHTALHTASDTPLDPPPYLLYMKILLF
jgi:hypothetical protein